MVASRLPVEESEFAENRAFIDFSDAFFGTDTALAYIFDATADQ